MSDIEITPQQMPARLARLRDLKPYKETMNAAIGVRFGD